MRRWVTTGWRPLVLGLAAVAALTGSASAQTFAEKLQLCGACHGEDGNAKLEKIPSLAGQPSFFILNQLFLMREGVRKVEAMAPHVKDMKDEEMTAFAEHFAKLPAKPSGETIDPVLVAKGEKISAERRCGSCHLPSLAGQEQMPRVAKQRIDYLIPTLKSYRDAPRPGADTAMSAAIVGASDDDLAALAHYAASK